MNANYAMKLFSLLTTASSCYMQKCTISSSCMKRICLKADPSWCLGQKNSMLHTSVCKSDRKVLRVQRPPGRLLRLIWLHCSPDARSCSVMTIFFDTMRCKVLFVEKFRSVNIRWLITSIYESGLCSKTLLCFSRNRSAYCHEKGIAVTNNNGFLISWLGLLALLYDYS
jgi:hypothetical protein